MLKSKEKRKTQESIESETSYGKVTKRRETSHKIKPRASPYPAGDHKATRKHK